LTKLHEEVRRGDLASLAAAYAAMPAPRGEIVIVVAPPDADASMTAPADVDALLRAALARVSLKEAVGEVAAVTGRPRREVYQRALALAKGGDSGG
jgi:16S rRNA (cytidine1402-2'-O)-methyltransferase